MPVLVPLIGQQAADSTADAFGRSAGPFRAMALHIERRGSWSGGGFQTAEIAGEAVLERCQIFHASPCTLLSNNEAIRSAPSDGAGRPRQDMPRVRYSGAFNPEFIPGHTSAGRSDRAVLGYAAFAGPKAAALHPWGRLFAVTTGPTDAAAAALALQRCNDDPERAGRNGPCLLYALGNQVVLPQRRTAAP